MKSFVSILSVVLCLSVFSFGGNKESKKSSTKEKTKVTKCDTNESSCCSSAKADGKSCCKSDKEKVEKK
jgi:hypothetical protein